MKRALVTFAFAVIGLLAGTAGNVSAQSECQSNGVCKYDFSVASDDSWPDWIEYAFPLSGSNISVVPRSWLGKNTGVMNVRNPHDSPNPVIFYGNHEHLLWDPNVVGYGFSSAEATVGFTGDNGHTGWFDKKTDGYGLEDCHADTHAPRASEEVLLLTVRDNGESWVGAYIGGDLLPFGTAPHPPPPVPPAEPTGYSVMGLIQKDSMGIHILRRIEYMPEIPMGSRGYKLSVSVSQNQNGEWIAQASVYHGDGSLFNFETRSKLKSLPESESSSTVGVIGLVHAAPYCIYVPWHEGEFDRQFVVDSVTAWRE